MNIPLASSPKKTSPPKYKTHRPKYRGVITQLLALNPNKASGPDEIPPFMKEYANEIAPILTKIFHDKQWSCAKEMERCKCCRCF